MNSSATTSGDLVKALRVHTARHPIGVANKMSFLNLYWDADYVAVTASGQVYEFEIKVSRADFVRDRHKYRYRVYNGEKRGPRPNRFWYVTVPGIVRGDLPKWAGWLEWENRRLTERKKAPLMWRGRHRVKTILCLAKAMRKRGDG